MYASTWVNLEKKFERKKSHKRIMLNDFYIIQK